MSLCRADSGRVVAELARPADQPREPLFLAKTGVQNLSVATSLVTDRTEDGKAGRRACLERVVAPLNWLAPPVSAKPGG